MKDRSGREFEALARLREVTSLIAAEADPQKLVPVLLQQAIKLVGAERGFVVLFSRDQLEVAAAHNIDREKIQDPDRKFSRQIVRRVATSGVAELIQDAEGEEGTKNLTSVVGLKLRSVLCVPLAAHGRTHGAMYVDHRYVAGQFDREDLATLEVFATQAGLALDASLRMGELRTERDKLEKQREELARRVETIERLRAELAERYREQSREANRFRAQATAAPVAPGDQIPGVIARSPAMRRVVEVVRKAAASDATVLISGESGVGKEVVARALHRLSARREGPFLAENCAALADPLLESELFGHEPGAFTGAVQAHAGLFETARGGTLLLDEVGEMSPLLQAKLLRVLQEREIRRVGGEARIPVDVRVVAATHRDLEAMVGEGKFRADLFYRLNVVRVHVPPLRERLEDVPALLDHFVERAGGKVRIEPQARELLLAHSWPGNVRELENEVARLAVFAGEKGVVTPGLLSPAVLGRPSPHTAPAADAAGDPPITGIWPLDELEKEMVVRALRHARGNRTVAARLLGIPKSTLYRRFEKHGLEKNALEEDS